MTKPKSIYTSEHKRLCTWLTTKKEERAISIRQLAQRLDWSHAIVGKVFTGDRRLDVIEYLWMCQALDADAHEGLERITTTAQKGKKKSLRND